MPLIDDRGRLFGKLNIVDAAIGLAVGLLVPLVFGAYLLFQPPLPRLVSVEPSQVEQGATRVEVRGEHLSPAFRLVIGDVGARFLLADAEHGELVVPPLQPGSYDVILLDQAQELGRLPGALTVMAPAPVIEPVPVIGELVAVGSFSVPDLAEAQALWSMLQAVDEDTERPWNVLDAQPPEAGFAYSPPPAGIPLGNQFQIRAVVRFRCEVNGVQCDVFDVPLVRGTFVLLEFGPDRVAAAFRISDLHPVYTSVVDVALRVTGCSQGTYLTPDELSALRAAARSDVAPSRVEGALGPSIESFEVEGETSSGELIATAHIQVPVVKTGTGWMYGMGNYRDDSGIVRGGVVRVGAFFSAATPLVQVCGRIVDVGPAVVLN